MDNDEIVNSVGALDAAGGIDGTDMDLETSGDVDADTALAAGMGIESETMDPLADTDGISADAAGANAEIGELTGKIADVQGRKELTVDRMQRAQAVDSIMANMIKAFAAYRGFKSGTDMSGVDVKTGIDWNAALTNKLGVLRDESDELKGQRVQKYRDLAARVTAGRTEATAGATAKARADALALQVARNNEQIRANKAREALAATAEANKDREKPGDYRAIESELAASKKSHDSTNAELLKYTPTTAGKDRATIADNLVKSKDVIAKVLNVDRAELDDLSQEETKNLHALASTRAQDNSKASTTLLSQVNNAKIAKDTARLEKLLKYKDDLADGKLTTSVPEDVLQLNKRDKLMAADTATIEKMIEAAPDKGTLWDSAQEKVLKKVRDKEPITDTEANLLPNSVIPNIVVDDTPENRTRFPHARVGIGQAGKSVAQTGAPMVQSAGKPELSPLQLKQQAWLKGVAAGTIDRNKTPKPTE